MTPQATPPRLPRHQPTTPSPHRHRRAGGDPGHLTTGGIRRLPADLAAQCLAESAPALRGVLGSRLRGNDAASYPSAPATPPAGASLPTPSSPRRRGPRSPHNRGHPAVARRALAAQCLPESAPALRRDLDSRLRGNDAASYPSATATPPADDSLPTPSSPRRRGPRSPHNRGHPAMARQARRTVPARERTCAAGCTGFPPSGMTPQATPPRLSRLGLPATFATASRRRSSPSIWHLSSTASRSTSQTSVGMMSDRRKCNSRPALATWRGVRSARFERAQPV